MTFSLRNMKVVCNKSYFFPSRNMTEIFPSTSHFMSNHCRAQTSCFCSDQTMGDLPRPANFLNGPTKGAKYASRYLLDENNHLYQRKHKKGDQEFGRHLWICLKKDCTSSASTFSKEGEEEVRIVAFGSKKHQHVADRAQVCHKKCSICSFSQRGWGGNCTNILRWFSCVPWTKRGPKLGTRSLASCSES